MINFIADLAPGVVYPAIFIGIIFLGGAVLMPAMFLSMHGSINLAGLFFVTLFAAMTADVSWYTVGRLAKKEKLYSFGFIKKRMDEAKRFSSFFVRHGVTLVFTTKFVWGTRVASHILAGMHRISVYKFIGATVSGTAIWFWVLYFLLRSIDLGVSAAKVAAMRIQLVALIGLGAVVLINWFTGTYIRKKMMKHH